MLEYRKDFVCGNCDKGFNNRSNYRQHLSRSHPEQFKEDLEKRDVTYFECDGCGKHFTNKKWYEKHEREQCGIEKKADNYNYTCEICNRGFEKEKGYRVHLGRNHKEELKEIKRQEAFEKYKDYSFTCYFCDPVDGFDNAWSFSVHLSCKHKDEMGFICLFFALSLPYRCEDCEYITAFDNETSLNCHKAQKHGNSKAEVECVICEKQFKVSPYRVGRVKTCGSEDCVSDYRSKIMSGENHYAYIDGRASNDCYYGNNWYQVREEVLKRDNYTCNRCGMTQEEHLEEYDMKLHVDHWIPLRRYREIFDSDDFWKVANLKWNLETFCIPCHGKADASKDY